MTAAEIRIAVASNTPDTQTITARLQEEIA